LIREMIQLPSYPQFLDTNERDNKCITMGGFDLDQRPKSDREFHEFVSTSPSVLHLRDDSCNGIGQETSVTVVSRNVTQTFERLATTETAASSSLKIRKPKTSRAHDNKPRYQSYIGSYNSLGSSSMSRDQSTKPDTGASSSLKIRKPKTLDLDDSKNPYPSHIGNCDSFVYKYSTYQSNTSDIASTSLKMCNPKTLEAQDSKPQYQSHIGNCNSFGSSSVSTHSTSQSTNPPSVESGSRRLNSLSSFEDSTVSGHMRRIRSSGSLEDSVTSLLPDSVFDRLASSKTISTTLKSESLDGNDYKTIIRCVTPSPVLLPNSVLEKLASSKTMSKALKSESLEGNDDKKIVRCMTPSPMRKRLGMSRSLSSVELKGLNNENKKAIRLPSPGRPRFDIHDSKGLNNENKKTLRLPSPGRPRFDIHDSKGLNNENKKTLRLPSPGRPRFNNHASPVRSTLRQTMNDMVHVNNDTRHQVTPSPNKQVRLSVRTRATTPVRMRSTTPVRMRTNSMQSNVEEPPPTILPPRPLTANPPPKTTTLREGDESDLLSRGIPSRQTLLFYRLNAQDTYASKRLKSSPVRSRYPS